MIRMLCVMVFMLYTNAVYAAKQIDIYSMFSLGAAGTIIGYEVVNRLNAIQNEYEFRLVSLPGAAGDNAALKTIALARTGQDLLLWQGTSGYTFGKYVSANPNAYDRDNDLVPIASFAGTSFHLMVEPESDIKTVADLTSQFKKRDVVYFGSTSTNPATPFLNAIFLKSNNLKASKDLNYTTPFDITKSVLGKESDYTIFTPADVRGLKSLAISGSARSKLFPNVPTGKELGMDDFNFTSTMHIAVPKEKTEFGMKFAQIMFAVCHDPKFVEAVEKIGYDARCFSDEKLKSTIKAESDMIKKYEKDVVWK